MAEQIIGVDAAGTDTTQILATIQDLERRGIPAAWRNTGGPGLDALTIFAAAAAQTERIKLGTAIIPTWPRHPVVAVQQLQVLAQLAPGRIRFGAGPSHSVGIQRVFGIDYQAPLTNLREYVTIVRSLLHQGAVEFHGSQYHANATLAAPVPDVPVMASALREVSFELCGEVADGAISWVCPMDYLRETCLPALERGAQRSGRAAPPLIAHIPVCVHDDRQEAIAGVKEQFGRYAQSPFYAKMFEAAGFPESLEGEWSDAMSEAVAVVGTEERVAERLREAFAWGAGELMVSIVPAGADREASRERTLTLLADLVRA